MQYILFLLIYLCTGLVHAQTVSCPSARESAKQFFTENYNYPFVEYPNINLSSDFLYLIKSELACKKQGDSCAIDWDPWIGGQDGDIIGEPYFKVNSLGVLSSKVTVVLKVNNGLRPDGSDFIFKSKTTLILKRNSKNSCWEIYDHILKNNQSMRKALSNNYIRE